MEQLKTYAAPVIALVLLLVWFFVIRPKLGDAEAEAADDKAEKAGDKGDAQGPTHTPTSS